VVVCEFEEQSVEGGEVWKGSCIGRDER
jgi:hypothetical protein